MTVSLELHPLEVYYFACFYTGTLHNDSISENEAETDRILQNLGNLIDLMDEDTLKAYKDEMNTLDFSKLKNERCREMLEDTFDRASDRVRSLLHKSKK